MICFTSCLTKKDGLDLVSYCLLIYYQFLNSQNAWEGYCVLCTGCLMVDGRLGVYGKLNLGLLSASSI